MPRQRTLEQLERKIARLGPVRERADLLIELGERLFFSDVNRARGEFERARDLAEELRHYPALALAHQKLAGWFGRSDLWRESLSHAERALELYRGLHDSTGEGVALRLIGEAQITAGEYEQAEKTLNDALKMQVKGRGDDAGYTHGSLGILHWKRGERERARAAFEKAREIFRREENGLQEAYITNNLAVIESDLGSPARALVMLEELIPLREKLDDSSGLIETYSNIGTQYAMLADYTTALDYMMRGLELRERLGVGRLDFAYHNIAWVYSKLDRLEGARDYYTRALAIAEAREDRAEMCDYHASIASVASKQGETDVAIEHAERSIALAGELGNGEQAAAGYANLAAAYRRAGDLERALDAINRAIDATRSGERIQHLAEHLRALATIHNDRNDIDAAFAAARESMEVMERGSAASGLPELYELLAALHERRGETAEALAMERRRFESYSGSITAHTAQTLQSVTVRFDVERLRKDAEIARLNAERYQQELEMSRKELSLMALHLANKNEFLADLRRRIESDRHATEQFIGELSRRIEEGMTSDRDWAEFEGRFAQSNPDFTALLLERSGGRLSPTEIKVCSLLRTGLATKDIANILYLSPRTVESHRYNIHRKLELGSQKLVPWLMGLSQGEAE